MNKLLIKINKSFDEEINLAEYSEINHWSFDTFWRIIPKNSEDPNTLIWLKKFYFSLTKLERLYLRKTGLNVEWFKDL